MLRQLRNAAGYRTALAQVQRLLVGVLLQVWMVRHIIIIRLNIPPIYLPIGIAKLGPLLDIIWA